MTLQTEALSIKWSGVEQSKGGWDPGVGTSYFPGAYDDNMLSPCERALSHAPVKAIHSNHLIHITLTILLKCILTSSPAELLQFWTMKMDVHIREAGVCKTDKSCRDMTGFNGTIRLY